VPLRPVCSTNAVEDQRFVQRKQLVQTDDARLREHAEVAVISTEGETGAMMRSGRDPGGNEITLCIRCLEHRTARRLCADRSENGKERRTTSDGWGIIPHIVIRIVPV